MNKESGFQWKLGMFVIIGLVLFVSTIYFIGKQQNLFGSTFNLKSNFKSVSGLLSAITIYRSLEDQLSQD